MAYTHTGIAKWDRERSLSGIRGVIFSRSRIVSTVLPEEQAQEIKTVPVLRKVRVHNSSHERIFLPDLNHGGRGPKAK